MGAVESTIDRVLPVRCHAAIESASDAREMIPVENQRLIFPKNGPTKPLHLMGHQTGRGVIEATAQQLLALQRHSAKEAGILGINPTTFAGAIRAGGKVMGNDFDSGGYWAILDQYLEGGRFTGTEAAPAIGVTLSLVKGPELLALVDQVLDNHRDDLRQADSTMRPWVLCACPYLSKLHNVYLFALQHRKPDEVAYTVGRLAALPDRIGQSSVAAQKEALKEWAFVFADELDTLALNTPNVVDPLQEEVVQLSKLASRLRMSR